MLDWRSHGRWLLLQRHKLLLRGLCLHELWLGRHCLLHWGSLHKINKADRLIGLRHFFNLLHRRWSFWASTWSIFPSKWIVFHFCSQFFLFSANFLLTLFLFILFFAFNFLLPMIQIIILLSIYYRLLSNIEIATSWRLNDRFLFRWSSHRCLLLLSLYLHLALKYFCFLEATN